MFRAQIAKVIAVDLMAKSEKLLLIFFATIIRFLKWSDMIKTLRHKKSSDRQQNCHE